MSKAVAAVEADSKSKVIKVRRAVARALHFVGGVADPVGVAVVVAIMVASLGEVGPEVMQMDDDWSLVLAAVVVYGATQAAVQVALFLGELIDPDQSDGDDLYDAERLVGRIRDDVENGADAGHILANLRASGLPETLADLVYVLAAEHSQNADQGVWAPSDLYGAGGMLEAAGQRIDQA